MLIYTVDGRVSTPLLWGDLTRPTLHGMMVTNSLKIAHYITGRKVFDDLYQKYVKQFGYRDIKELTPEDLGMHRRHDHDDTEHVLGGLYLMVHLEDDPELLSFYRLAAEAIYENHRDDHQTLFDYFYKAITGKGIDEEKALELLRLYPTVKLMQPQMNSIRKDIEIITDPLTGRKLAKDPLPFNERPFDNEYEWKGNPYQLDGWLSRIVVAMDVSKEDPMVIFAVDDGGYLYQSLDGGRSWHEAAPGLRAKVRDVLISNRRTRVTFLATDRGIYRTENGGWNYGWEHVEVGSPGNSAYRLIPDPENDFVIYAITDEGIFRSTSYSLDDMGKVWENISGRSPNPGRMLYAIRPGDPTVMYATFRGKIYRKLLGEVDWQLMSDLEDYHIIPTFRKIAIDPESPDTVYLVATVEIWDRPVNFLIKSTNGGGSYVLLGKGNYRDYRGIGTGLEQVEVTDIAIDPHNRDVIYAASPDGVYKSMNGGIDWRQINIGLHIPRAGAVFAPGYGKIYVGTPAGLYESSDGGESWHEVIVLNGHGVNRTETGSMDYLFAYWLGRYEGFISDEEAAAEWWK